MSRSRRKYPIVVLEKNDAHYSNRVLRRNPMMKIPKGGAYKRYASNGWTAKYRWTLKDATETYFLSSWAQRTFPTLEEYLIWYKKKYVSK